MRVLITVVSGTGKSSLVLELRRRGFVAYDADDDGLTEPKGDGTWAWRIERIRSVLDDQHADLLFLAGCSEEQSRFRFDYTVVLTAPDDVIVERLRTRTSNPFGRAPAERRRVLDDKSWVEPLLRRVADLTVETAIPTADVADAVLGAIGQPPHRG